MYRKKILLNFFSEFKVFTSVLILYQVITCSAARVIRHVLMKSGGEEEIWRFQRSEKVMFELSQLWHVRLNKGSSFKHTPPRLETPQLQPQAAQEPGGGGGEVDSVEVLRHGLHVTSLQHHGHHWPGSPDTPEEALHCWTNVDLPGYQLQYLLHSHSSCRGLSQEGSNSGVGRGDQRYLAGSNLSSNVCQ